MFVKVSLKPVYSTMVGKNFQIYMFRFLEKGYANQKIESRHFYACPRQNPPKGSYYHPKGRGKLLILPASVFFEILFPPPAESGERREGRKLGFALSKL